MAEVLFFKSPQVKEDIFAGLEREALNQARLEGVPSEIIEATMARIRRLYDRGIGKTTVSFSFSPIIRLTVEEAAALGRQIESLITQEVYEKYLVHFMKAAMMELAQAEAELYKARRGDIE